MMTDIFINLTYMLSAALFVFGLKFMSKPQRARLGNGLSALGMTMAILVTLLAPHLDYVKIGTGFAIGAVIGAVAALKVPMTAMPEMVALFNGSGGAASLIVGWAVYHSDPRQPFLTLLTIFLSVLIGGVTFSGSLVAWGKLSEKITGKPILFKGQQILNAFILLSVLVLGIWWMSQDTLYSLFVTIVGLSLVLGILVVIPIGGADMPVVISLLNSYSGLAACAAGFVIQNLLLIVAGALVGASGLILTAIMCKAMNRSLTNVLFSGFGATVQQAKGKVHGEVRPISPEDAYYILEAARRVVFVPGYGLAVAQAQHVLRELGELLEKNGAEVMYAIHPVAGRMPGHMNVLLAEANVPYDQLVEMDDVNPIMDTVDVAVVVGANDVVNPAALNEPTSPIYGMPVIEVHRAKTVIVLKRSLNPGFAGVQNELFYYENTRMLFGDAKQSIQELVAQFKEA